MLRDGSYTVVALTQSSGAALAFLRDQAGVPGAGRLRPPPPRDRRLMNDPG